MTRTMRVFTRVDGVESFIEIPLPNIPIEDIDMKNDVPGFRYPEGALSDDANAVRVYTVCDMENQEERGKNKIYKRMGFMDPQGDGKLMY